MYMYFILKCSLSLSSLNLAHKHINLLTEAEERALDTVRDCIVVTFVP